MYNKFFKRTFDILISLIVILLICPIFFLILVSLFFSNRGKPFFIQSRPGRNERIFKIIKFRTMNEKRGDDGNLLSDIERTTKIGSLIRKTSLDELPQLINVLIGDMSIIGPRPLLIEYLPLYSLEHARRHSIRPGITGWSQVNGRNLMKLSKKFDFDIFYVDNVSFKFDLKILILTLKRVILSRDVGNGADDMNFVDDLDFNLKLKNFKNETYQ
jgi:undecaprenyl phosphate N,N'-diacetylbacillosamine 1-phosphate transferase